MRLSDVVSHSGLARYAEVALVLFFLAFILIVVRLWARRDRQHLERMRRMPLDDEPHGSRSHAMTAKPGKDAKKGHEEDRLLDHHPDGIQEYDNPLPRWWLTLFWATLIFAVLYALNLPGIGSGKGRISNYERDMARARERQAALAAKSPPPTAPTEAGLLALAKDPAQVKQGRERFVTTCAACHREDGGGSIGPNLTDDFWIHGGRPLAILKTVTDGVPDKGMVAWGQTLQPDEIAAVVAYVLTLHDTHPPNPKDPQGTKVEVEAEHP